MWVAELRDGWTTSQLWAALAASPEFVARWPASSWASALVFEAFERIVGRHADDSSHAYWRDRFLRAPSRSAVLRALVLTPEALGRIVSTTYVGVLGRTASPVEQAVTQASIRERRGDWQQLTAEILGWPEASTFAQRYP